MILTRHGKRQSSIRVYLYNLEFVILATGGFRCIEKLDSRLARMTNL